jgi:hypothetical protein
MGLVETDLANSSGSRSHFTFHAPCTQRTREALFSAGLGIQPIPAKSADLVNRRFDAVIAGRFQPILGKHPINAASLPDVLHFLKGETTEGEDHEAGAGAAKEERPPSITMCDLRRRKYGVDRIVLSPPLTSVRMPKPTAGEKEPYCAYEQTLRKILLDAIHICYLQAFARLADPAVVGAMHIPIVMSGFCFGPLDDPVDNILVNALWFKTAFPSQSPAAAAGLQREARRPRSALARRRRRLPLHTVRHRVPPRRHAAPLPRRRVQRRARGGAGRARRPRAVGLHGELRPRAEP